MTFRPGRSATSQQQNQTSVWERLADITAECFDNFLTLWKSMQPQLVPVRVPARKPTPQSPRSSDSRHGYLQS